MTRGPSRARGSTLTASLVGGAGDVLDFLVPLWAGVTLGLSPAQIGTLVALELLVSFLARPIAGWLSDSRERTHIAAAGAALYGLSCLGYALAPSFAIALVAAVLGGLGGALVWVSVRAITGERLAEDPQAFADLFGAIAFASWFFWVPALVLLPMVGYPGVFAALGLACFVAAVLVARAPSRAHEHPGPRSSARAAIRRLAPLLGVAGLSSLAEAGIGLLLLLHLQRAFELEVFQIALVFLPGGIAMTVLPGALHRFTVRFGRRTVYSVASLGSAAFAASLALSPGPLVIAGLWVLTGVAWAAIMPIHEAVVSEASGSWAGRGMSLLSSAGLLGGAAGAGLAGTLYGSASWQVACVVFATLIAAGAVAGPLALARLGVRNRPSAVEASEQVAGEST